MAETNLQSKMNKWLRDNDIMYHHREKGRYNKGVSHNYVMRVVKGEKKKCKFPDLTIFPGDRISFFIEVKVDNNKLSPEQQNFKEWAIEKGYQFYECRSMDMFLSILAYEKVIR